MQTERQSRGAGWRALCAALFLLFGAVSASVALTISSADVCTMACCIEEGRCCCKPRHAFVEGQAGDGKPRFAANEIAAPCPPDCAGSSTSSPSFPRTALGPAAHPIIDAVAPTARLPLLVSQSLAAACDATAPRAPPVRLLHSAN
jgi:hypothetical protein